MDRPTFILAFISSTATLVYLIRGLYLYVKQWPSIQAEAAQEKDRRLRIQLNHLYPDHVMLTFFLLAMAVAVGLPGPLFFLFFLYFIIVKWSKGFALLRIEKVFTPWLRNLGMLVVLLPMVFLSVFILFKVCCMCVIL